MSPKGWAAIVGATVGVLGLIGTAAAHWSDLRSAVATNTVGITEQDRRIHLYQLHIGARLDAVDAKLTRIEQHLLENRE